MDLAGTRTVKRFRVAREGQTVDGRAISRQQIIDMAETYDPVEYTARINVEHMGGWNFLGNTAIPALGDVIAADCQLETFTINGSKVELMCLYATLSALPQLVEANKQGQKLYTSIEFYPKFADTGRAYLVGLAVTDIPASRGIEALKFSKTNQNSFFSEPQELTLMSANPTANPNPTETPSSPTSTAPIENAPVPSQTPPATQNNSVEENSFLQKMANMFSKKSDGMTDQEQTVILESFNKINEKVEAYGIDNAQTLEQIQALTAQVSQLNQNYANLHTQLSKTPADTTTTPPASGAGYALTEF